MPHFTYEANLDKSNLHQGDVIERSQDVETILREVHPHYCQNEDYKYFMVITQSCDLLRRCGNCSARYITIAAIRPFKLAIEREIQEFQYDQIEKQLGICNDTKKVKIEQFVERLLNNNEQEYFFLFKEPSLGLNESYCAFLRLTIALKTKLHYETLLNSKILQLKDSFQHKLGYLVGNCYSRIGTDDWVPKNINKKEFQKLINDYIEQIETITWLDKDNHNYILKKMKKLPENEKTIEKVKQLLEQRAMGKEEKQKEVVGIIGYVLQELKIDAGLIESAKKRLINRPDFRASLK